MKITKFNINNTILPEGVYWRWIDEELKWRTDTYKPIDSRRTHHTALKLGNYGTDIYQEIKNNDLILEDKHSREIVQVGTLAYELIEELSLSKEKQDKLFTDEEPIIQTEWKTYYDAFKPQTIFKGEENNKPNTQRKELKGDKMNINDLIEILIEAREKGITKVEIQETVIFDWGSEQTFHEEIDAVMINKARNSVVLSLDGL